MGECRGGGGGGGEDCLIKLFGTTIPVPEAGDAKDLQHNGGSSSSSTESDAKQENTHRQDTFQLDPPSQPEVVDAEDPKASPESRQQPGDDDQKLKKPDKVLPCPRCNSMDTKFCYFNNYNVNQPRHFCKNCQRYWTAGGAMRNVPVGAGRRKNKNAASAAASHFLQRVVRAAALPAAGDPLKTSNGTVLSFGHGAQAVDNLADQVRHLKDHQKLLIPIGNTAGNNRPVGPCSEGSSSCRDDKSTSDIREKVTAVDKPPATANNNGVMQHPANMWPYSCAPTASSQAPAAYYPPGIAFPIFPSAPAYWGCMVPGGWSLPWPVQQSPTQGFVSSPTSAPSVSSGAGDSLITPGKHPRDDGDEGRSHGRNGKVWAPKTIRIDDADEVARSSIWSLIGMKAGDKLNTNMDGRKHGTAFESKHETAKQAMITSSPLLLHANPVALTRSLTFQEGS